VGYHLGGIRIRFGKPPQWKRETRWSTNNTN